MKNSLSKMIVNFSYIRKIIKTRVNDYFHLFTAKIYLAVLLFLNILAWIMAYLLTVNITQKLIFLHYNIIFGRDLVGPVAEVYFWPLMGLAIIILNIIIVLTIYRTHKMLTQILLIGAGVANIILILALYSLYLVNFVQI